jgi:hypothetical protein
MKKWVLLLLFVLIACAPPQAPPAEEKVVEKVVVQCWDGSTAESVDKCPEKPEEKVEEKAEAPEALPPSEVIVEEPAVPIAKKLLADAQTKFKGYAYVLEDQMVIVYGSKLRHMFLEISQLEDRTPITDVFVDLDKREAVAYCNIEREGKILDDAFDYERSRCKDYVDKPIPVPFEKWVPKGPLEYLQEFAEVEPMLVENNLQTISIGGNSKSIQPSLHYDVGGRRVILRIDRRYQVPIKVEFEGQQSVDFRETYFDVMVVYGGQQKITPEWVEYKPVSEYWKALGSK